MTYHDPLMQRQIELEIEMSGLGRENYLSSIRKDMEKGRGHATKTGQYILGATVGPVADGIRVFLDEALSGTAGRPMKAAKLLKDIDPDTIAYLTCRTVLGRMMKPAVPVLMTLAVSVARAVELEARFTEFKSRNQSLFDFQLRRLTERGSTETQKAAVLIYAMGKHDIPWDRWTGTDRIHRGGPGF